MAAAERCLQRLRTDYIDLFLYNLARRGIELDLLPWCGAHGVVPMAYSPLEQGRLDWGGALGEAATAVGATPRQVALAWTLRLPRIVSVVKSANEDHVQENSAALSLRLPDPVLGLLDRAYPAPNAPVPLESL